MASVAVSIPSISTSSDGKYTVYDIIVEINGKSSTIQKRYSDFDSLKNELESLYSDQLPYQFPKKTFIRSSVSNEKLAQERRILFEKFLKDAIKDETNTKWKKSLPFREFLNLPPGIFTNITEHTKEDINAAFALSSSKATEPIIDISTWIEVARETKDTLRSARGVAYSFPTDSRKKLLVGRSRFEGLSKGLEYAESNSTLGIGEVKRRRELLNSLKREHADIEQLLSTISGTSDSSSKKTSFNQVKNQLFKGRVIGKPQETERTQSLDNQQLLQLQKNDFKEQDQELDELVKVIQRQKELGLAINEELAIQNDLLDELDSEVDRTSSKLHYASKRIGKLT